MTYYLLDSNHASPLVTLSHPLRLAVLDRTARGHSFAISVPVLTETLFGLYLLPRAEQSIAEWSRLRQGINCYQVDEADALVAATALRYDLVLLTTDKDFDAVPDLKRENWLASPAAR